MLAGNPLTTVSFSLGAATGYGSLMPPMPSRHGRR
jgi:hypothetical protein